MPGYDKFLEVAKKAPENSDLDRAYKAAIQEVDSLKSKVEKLTEENAKLKEDKKASKATASKATASKTKTAAAS